MTSTRSRCRVDLGASQEQDCNGNPTRVMGKRRPITVGKMEFAAAKFATEYVRRLVARYPDNAVANQADTEFLTDLLELHPRCEEKVGCGVRAFKFKTNPEYTNTRTIFIVRTDGSETDFSWTKCIDGETPERLKRAALRHAVAEQILDFKREALSRGRVVCPETGEDLSWDFCHVDHCAPNTFDKLINDWLAAAELTLDSIEISPSRDSSFNRVLTNKVQCESWREFHRQRKQLRLLSPRANLSLPKHKR